MDWHRSHITTWRRLCYAGVASLSLVLLAACTAGKLAAPAVEEGWTHHRDQYEGPVAADAAFSIVNPYGDVRVRTSRRGSVLVTSQVQQHGDEDFNIRIDDDDGVRAITVIASNERPRGRVDMSVLLPPGKEVELETAGNLAELKYAGHGRIRTTSGAVSVETAHHVDVETDSGNVDYALRAVSPSRALTIETRGEINAWFLPEANLELIAAAAGPVRISLPGYERVQDQPHRAAVVLGRGGPRIILNSSEGSVRVRPLPPG
ncbi:MAG: hypothetical protein KJO55_06345 [Gammaproteobacteria bacterium]|nr:hypothetical protein [Gammaproteobacteria bacterium]NND59492.1 hypothetical protein [Gammaproteobacteria bacterium]